MIFFWVDLSGRQKPLANCPSILHYQPSSLTPLVQILTPAGHLYPGLGLSSASLLTILKGNKSSLDRLQTVYKQIDISWSLTKCKDRQLCEIQYQFWKCINANEDVSWKYYPITFLDTKFSLMTVLLLFWLMIPFFLFITSLALHIS